jgi:hypothetical protein
MKTEHTPGPWKAMMDKNGIVHICPNAIYEHNICEVIESPTSLSNARLIAAAPLLLKALESMSLSMRAHPDYTEGSEFEDMVSTAEDAIKKARG